MSVKDIIIVLVLISLGIYLFLQHKITNKTLGIFIGIIFVVCISLSIALSKPKPNCPPFPTTEIPPSCPLCPNTP